MRNKKVSGALQYINTIAQAFFYKLRWWCFYIVYWDFHTLRTPLHIEMVQTYEVFCNYFPGSVLFSRL